MAFRGLTRMVLFLFLPVVSAGSAEAVEFPLPKTDYSAEMEMNMGFGTDGKPLVMTGMVYASKKSERREVEQGGKRMIMISHRDGRPGWMILPENKSYMEFPKGAGEKDPRRMMEKGNLKLTKMGSEEVRGVKTLKYGLLGKNDDGTEFKGFMWLTKENIPVRIEGEADSAGRRQHFRVDYRNIRPGPQDPALFKIPPGYRQIRWPLMAGTGTGGEGGPKEDLRPDGARKEEMKKQMEELKKYNDNPEEGD